MSQPTPTQTNADNGGLFIRQVYLRGQLAPAFQPPTKKCPRCCKSFQSVRTMCLPCLKAVSLEKQNDTLDRSRDTYLDACETCKKTTLYLGPSWCITCYAVPDNTFPVYCEECVVQNDIPNRVRDDKGGFVDMLKNRCLRWFGRLRRRKDARPNADVMEKGEGLMSDW